MAQYSRNSIYRLGIDASDFQKKMQQAGASAASAGKRIKQELNLNGLGTEVSKIMGWSGAATGVGSITSDNVGMAQNQLGILRSYRDQLAGAGFDDYQFGLVSEQIKALQYDIEAYSQSVKQAAEEERQAAEMERQAADAKAEKDRLGALSFEEAIQRRTQSLKEFESATSRIRTSVEDIMGWSYYPSEQIGSVTDQNVKKARKQLATLREYQRALQDFSPKGKETETALVSGKIMSLEYALDSYVQSLNRAADAEREAAQGAAQVGKETSKSESFISRISRSLRGVGSSGRQLSSIPGFFRRIGDSAGSSNTRIDRMLRSIRNISIVSFAARIAGAAFGELRSIVQSYISENAQLQAQVNALKSSLGQALAPAINIVTNAFSTLMPYVVGISNAIGQLMAALTGSGWSTAASNAGKTAAATGTAAKAQEQMNRQLMSFDELNKLNADTSSYGGGGSGAGTDIAQIESKTPAWLERFKQSFSDLFNSEEFQAANIGGKIGMSLQTGLDWLGSEGVQFDWRGVGQKLRENFDSFMASGWTDSLFHTVGIYLGGFSDFVIGIMGPQWEELQTAYEDGGTLGAVGYVAGIVAGLPGNILSAAFERVLSPIFSGLADYFRENGNDSVAGFFQGISDKMAEAGQWIKENFTDPIVNKVKEWFGIHSPSTVFAEIGGSLMDGLTGGISDKITGVTDKLTELKDRVFGIADNLKSAFSFDWQMPSLKLPHLILDWEPVDNIVAQFFGVSAFPHLSVSWYAKGGILDGAQIFGRTGSTLLGGGEAGKEAVLPLEQNTGWMDMIAERVVSLLAIQDSGDISVTIPVSLDGEVITRVVAERLRKMSRAGSMPW